jgi:KUP system potassium uptake protein
MGGLLTLDVLLVASCAIKFVDGAWFPIAVAVALFFFMSTWSRGSEMLLAAVQTETPPLQPFVAWLAEQELPRAERTAVFAVADAGCVPWALLANLKHNRVLVRERSGY